MKLVAQLESRPACFSYICMIVFEASSVLELKGSEEDGMLLITVPHRQEAVMVLLPRASPCLWGSLTNLPFTGALLIWGVVPSSILQIFHK